MNRQKMINRCDIAFGLALILKIFSSGIAYFPILDDYVQYGSYPLFDLGYVFGHIGTVCARPFASLLDPTLWGMFWGHMWAALLLMTAVYFVACLMLDRILSAEGMKITPLLYTVCFLLPLTFEGTYWISASSRIVMGLFFSAASSMVLQKYLANGKKRFLPLYAALCLLSFGFYESVMIFSGLLQIFVLIKHITGCKNYRRLWLLAIPATGAAILLIYYKLASEIGVLASRATGFSIEHIGKQFSSLVAQFGYIFSAGLFRTTINGFIDGFRWLLASPLWGICILVLIFAISALCAYSCRKHNFRANATLCIPLGLALTFLPLLPNMLVPDVWLTYRSIAVCIPGLCIMVAPFLQWLFRNQYMRMAATFLMVFVFSIGCVNEVQTYKKVHETDTRLLTELISQLDEDVLAGKKNTLLVLPHEIAVPQTSYYKDHVKSVFYSDWSLTGAVRATTRNNSIKTITPVYSLEGIDTEGNQVLYMNSTYQITEAQYE